MPLKETPFDLPDGPLFDHKGEDTSARAALAHPDGRTLVIVGHQSCKTTRQTLPYVDRIHASGGRTIALLQDPVVGAAEALAKLKATLPFVSEPDPYVFTRALGVEVVPTLLLVERDGKVVARSEAFSKAALESYADALGVPSPILPGDTMPATKPG